MPLVPPNLDNRTFNQLVTEIRRRIPTATPEWTDLNPSDPGITLAELFAFLSEQLLFQVNQVPTKGLITFLQMVGAELHPATPAVADVTFTALGVSGGPDLTFDLRKGTRIETSGPPPGKKQALVFETSRDLTVLNGSLVALASLDCNLDYTFHTTTNENARDGFLPFGSGATTADQFFLVFDLGPQSPLPAWPEGTFSLRVNVFGSSDVGDPPPLGSLAPPARLAWDYASGVATQPDGSQSLTFSPFADVVDSTNDFLRSGYLQFVFDPTVAAAFLRAPSASTLEPEAFRGRFVLRARVIREEAYAGDDVPSLATLRLNSAPASAVQTKLNEALGGSSGLPFQRFRLANAPVVVGSSEVIVDESSEGGGPVSWHEVQDLFAAGPTERVYQLLPATGELLFGNGEFGKIPPPDDGSVPGGNMRAAFYQFGGGLHTNVGAGTLTNVTVIDSGLPGFDSTNVLAAAGGADEEPVAQGVARAPAVVRSRYRAVSATDFEALAKETPDVRVARAHTLPNSRPGCNPGASPGSVTLVLVPYVTYAAAVQSPVLVPSHVAESVLRYLDTRRLVTTEVFTASAEFRKVTVEARVTVEPRAGVSATASAVVAALNRYFHALEGGDEGEGWPFGGAVYFSRVFERILAAEGVLRADQVRVALDDGPFVECQDLEIGAGRLLYSGQHQVIASAVRTNG
ncbi:MAG: putative baseplate assembly protein [Polyangiaceae bacterium]